jgi:hypothetical protein
VDQIFAPQTGCRLIVMSAYFKAISSRFGRRPEFLFRLARSQQGIPLPEWDKTPGPADCIADKLLKMIDQDPAMKKRAAEFVCQLGSVTLRLIEV